ncbi:MAG: hypothetical protein AB8G16_18050, partial [Gammaproteobacteria bacterium]
MKIGLKLNIAALNGILLCCSLALGANAAPRVSVAVLTDGPQYQLQDVEQTFRDELIALTTGEFDVQFTSVPANWSSDGINAALDGAYANPQIDY